MKLVEHENILFRSKISFEIDYYILMYNDVSLDLQLLSYNGTTDSLSKILTNEKRGGLKVVSFDRSPFKLFTLRFSEKSVQAPFCERPRTAPRTLFLSFANNNCFQIAVSRRSCMKKSGKLACHVVNSNIAFGSLPTLQISLGIVALFERFMMESRFVPSFQISGRLYNTVVSIKCMM
jgi:hypothetical protein